jgi:allophanate hydrolase subunit 2
VDVSRFTQLRPGERIGFARIPLAVALKLQLQRERDLGRARMGLARLTG